ncbi:MAG: hypothetical protein CVV44_00575 [Spirochaetae bacterium HGW-Spirochaetae-1]|nr:MAG: hypothetical protein CVV44_00575 [Spirochaetae bacterium HGW-Spirochaetae-1]
MIVYMDGKLHRGIIILLVLCLAPLFTGCGKSKTREHQSLDQYIIMEAEKKYQSPDWKIRLEAIQDIIGISNYGTLSMADKQTESLLLDATRDIHGAVKIEALKGLARYHSDRVLNRLLEMSLDERDGNVRWFTLLTLGQHRSPRAVPAFLQNIKSEDWLIREASIKGILLLRDETLQRDLEPQIIKALNDPSISVKITTLKYLSIKSPGIYEALSSIIKAKTPPPYSLMRSALVAIKGYSLDSATREKIITLLTHSNTTIRILALRVLKEEQNIPVLEEKTDR